MSTKIKGQAAVLGLTIMLSGPVFGQADSGAAARKHIEFTDINVRDNSDGKHKMYAIRATDADGNTYSMRKSDDRIVELEVNGKPVPKDQYAHYDKLLGHLERPPVPPVPPTPASPAAPAAPVAPAVPAAPASAGSVTPAAPAGPGASPNITAPVPPLPPSPPAPPEPPRANKYISHIIDDLLNKGIINEETRLTFSLDNEQMTVNGVKQADDVFETFKQKYIKHAGDHFRYERQGSSMTTNIKTDDDNH